MRLLPMLFIVLFMASCNNPLTQEESRSGFGTGDDSSESPDIPVVSPNLLEISDQSLDANSSAITLSLNLEDVDDGLTCSSLLSVANADPTLINNASLVISGTTPSCQLSVAPVTDQFGESSLTLTLTSGETTVSRSFTVDVNINASIFPGLQVWFDGADTSTTFINDDCTGSAVNDGDSVGCWMDKSGNDFHATMGTAAQKPIRNQLSQPGTIEFDGVNDFFYNSYSFSARTVFVVFRIDSLLQSSSDLAQIWGHYSFGHVAPDPRTIGLTSFDGSSAATARYSVGGNSLSSAAYDNGSVQPWALNQTEMMRVEYTSSLNFTAQVIGSLYPIFAIGAHQLGGQISEIVVLSGTQTNADAELMEGYLACKWNLQSDLPMAHPYKATCP